MCHESWATASLPTAHFLLQNTCDSCRYSSNRGARLKPAQNSAHRAPPHLGCHLLVLAPVLVHLTLQVCGRLLLLRLTAAAATASGATPPAAAAPAAATAAALLLHAATTGAAATTTALPAAAAALPAAAAPAGVCRCGEGLLAAAGSKRTRRTGRSQTAARRRLPASTVLSGELVALGLGGTLPGARE